MTALRIPLMSLVLGLSLAALPFGIRLAPSFAPAEATAAAPR